MKILAWGRTDAGPKRSHNEDAFLVSDEPALLAVADGMGGHVGGARASRLAVDVLLGELRAQRLDGPVSYDGDVEPVPLVALREAARAAGRAIYDAAQSDAAVRGMGTTLTALLVVEGRGFLAHVGDSRAYVFRDGSLQQVSEDHSWVQEQHKAGWMTFDETRTSKFRHVITRSVGYEREVKVDATTFPVHMGDAFLLSTDGLTTVVRDDEIADVLAARFYEDAPEALVKMACDRGGEDNVTVVVAYAANV